MFRSLFYVSLFPYTLNTHTAQISRWNLSPAKHSLQGYSSFQVGLMYRFGFYPSSFLFSFPFVFVMIYLAS